VEEVSGDVSVLVVGEEGLFVMEQVFPGVCALVKGGVEVRVVGEPLLEVGGKEAVNFSKIVCGKAIEWVNERGGIIASVIGGCGVSNDAFEFTLLAGMFDFFKKSSDLSALLGANFPV